ncbi:MAG: two-component sensor histidine kinase [Actinobacteria bacterium]|nr:two-component sensor histidine kinase [Actinomycetota bacterium]
MSRRPRPSPLSYPRWVPPLVAVPPLFFGVVSVTGAGSAWWVVAIAVGVAFLPWVVNAIRPGWPPPTVFVLWVATPLALLNTVGDAHGVDLSAEGHSQFTLMILVWLVGEMASRARLAPMLLAGLTTIGTVVGRTIAEPSFAHAWLFWLGGAGVALLTGFLLRRQQTTLSELRAAQAALAGEAARRERQRIAREVHDVVAHTLTVTLMHVGAARRALERDPSAAREALDDAETLGRRSLADIRRTVGLLRAEDEQPDTHALPDASDIPTLLDSYRAAGTTLDVETTGDLAELSPAAGLTLYRLVQEALSNASAHAPGAPVDVRLRVRRHEAEVVVSNPVPATGADTSGSGLGVIGMRERVGLLGGRLDAGARDGTWSVRARVPLDSATTSGTPA